MFLSVFHADYEKLTMSQVSRIELDDRRAQQVLLVYLGGFYYAVPAPELFSRHTGVCRVIGDKNQRSVEHCLQVCVLAPAGNGQRT